MIHGTLLRFIRTNFKLMIDDASLRRTPRVPNFNGEVILWRKMHAKWHFGGFLIDLLPVETRNSCLSEASSVTIFTPRLIQRLTWEWYIHLSWVGFELKTSRSSIRRANNCVIIAVVLIVHSCLDQPKIRAIRQQLVVAIICMGKVELSKSRGRTVWRRHPSWDSAKWDSAKWKSAKWDSAKW